ncbi:MAG: septum formation initiator family protein [Actinomycetota bacterium]|nr:septum formation initiator family protein [Actinomycetota bacterium]
MATRRPKVPRAHLAGGAKVPEPDAAASPTADGVAADTQAKRPAVSAARSLAAGARRRGTGVRGAGAGPQSAPQSGAKTAGARGAAAQPELRPIPAKAFSGRLLALAVVLLTITLLLAPSVRTFLQQRSEITALQQDIEAKKQQQTGLNTELSRWDDPAYVKQQARDRVNMMMPGETGYWVYGGDGASTAPKGSGSPGAAAGGGSSPGTLPWVDGLWLSIKRSATE